jgi:predicted Zn-dependent peptidase
VSGRNGRVSRSPLVTGEIRRDTLAGGLRLVTEQVRSSRTFSVGFFVPVGSRHESARLAGASHFLEHLLFKGTRRRTAEEISAEIESVGGDLNAYTAKEHTCFYARVVDSDAERAVDVLSDMITSSRLATADVNSERAVILDEISMHADDPAEVAHELINTALFGDRGLGAPVIGSLASVGALTRAQVARHWRRHYRPENLVVAATGHLDHDRLRDQLAPLATGPEEASPHSSPPTGSAEEDRLCTARRSLEQVTAVLAFAGPGVFDARRYPLGILSLIVGGGMSSRLFVEVRERRGLTYGIDAGETSYTDAGLWTVDWQCAPERLGEIADLVRGILLDVAEHGVRPEELSRAQGQMRGQTLLTYEGPVSRMTRLGSNTLIGDERSLAELLERYEAVTPDEVQAVAADLFGQPPVLALVGPRVPTRPLWRMLTHWPD